MNLFTPIFDLIPNWWQAILIMLLIAVYSILFSFLYTKSKRVEGYYKDTPIVLTILPIVVSVLVMMVCVIAYNLGGSSSSEYFTRIARVSIAIVAALMIFRIRSEQRSPEIIAYYLFLLVLGFVVGSGYLLFSVVFYAFILLILVVMYFLKYPSKGKDRLLLKIKIPEDLNFEHAFDDIFEKYCKSTSFIRVKSVDLGSIFQLQYIVILKPNTNKKEFLDEIRKRNSNLDIILIADEFRVNDK